MDANGVNLEDIKSNTISELGEPISCETTTPEIIVPESCFAFNNVTGTITAYASGYGACVKDVVIPSTINGVTVASIGASAFKDNELTSVFIPDTITSISNDAFAYNELTTIVIPDSVITLGEGAFQHNQLTDIEIPNNFNKIEKYTFRYNQLTEITLLSNVTIIGEDAFSFNLINNVEIPNNVTRLEWGAFGNNQITSVTIPNTVTYIGTYAFVSNQIESLTIPNSMTTIKFGSFGNNNISSLVLPNTITSIESYGFDRNDLTSIVIPENVTSIGTNAFNLNLLQSVTLPNGIISIGDGSFSMNQITSIDIPFGITNIGSSAFEYNYILQGDAVIDSSAAAITIGSNAFANNGADGATTITPVFLREYAFNYTGENQVFTAPYTGNYQIELWGAQGGDGIKLGGRGAYTKGNISLTQGQSLNIYVGESGINSFGATFNGGGAGSARYGKEAGGGATDIRLVAESNNKYRYVRDYTNGNTANTTNHWVQIQAYATLKEGDTVGGVLVGGKYTGAIEINELYSGAADAGEIFVEGTGEFIYPDGTRVANIDGVNKHISTFYESSSKYITGFIMFIGTDDSRFSIVSNGSHMFVNTLYNNDTWYYDNNSTWVEFTPNENDRIIGYTSTVTSQNTITEMSHSTYPFTFNAALGKNVTGSTSISYPVRIINGETDVDDYASGGTGLQYVEVDLGEEYNIEYINVRHYYKDGRTYHDTKTILYNEDRSLENVIFDSAISGEYPELRGGKNLIPDLASINSRIMVAAGGGGGWYGGSGGSGGNTTGWCGGGGSSFISGHAGCNAVNSSGAHTGQPDHFSGYVFTNTVMIDGAGYNWTDVKGEQVRMPKPDGTLYELGKGHEGNGYAKITLIEIFE